MKKLLFFLIVALIFLGCSACEFTRAYKKGANYRTMSELRDLAKAIEMYKIDHGSYPEAINIDGLREILMPKYIKSMTGRDRWGEPFLVDCKTDGYTLSSKGDDKIGEHEFGGAVDFRGHSITLKDGAFVQYYAFIDEAAREFEAEITSVKKNKRSGT